MELDSSDGCTALQMLCVYFKKVKIMNFMLCEFYLNDNKKWIQEQDVENKSSSEKIFNSLLKPSTGHQY